MFVLIIGGAASGKSALAEEYCARLGKRRVYIATMSADDAESLKRIEKHREARLNKGFTTVERPFALQELSLQGFDCGLLECLSNLVANEMFGEKIPVKELTGHILRGIAHVRGQLSALVVVTNDVFGASESYDGEMADYLKCLGELNRELAKTADVVIESVCGLPVVLKSINTSSKRSPFGEFSAILR